MSAEQWLVHGRTSLDLAEVSAVRQLIAECDARDQTRLKIAVSAGANVAGTTPSMFLVYDGASLAGCWSVDYDGGHDAEMCGVVAPGYRRRGIGRALFSTAREALRQGGASTVLLICEERSESGLAFVAAMNGSLRHKELHMERSADQVAPLSPPTKGVEVRPATRADVDALVRIMTRAFGDDEGSVRRRVGGEVDDLVMPYLLLSANGEVVGSLKPYDLSGTIGIYAVGVLPERQGHGYGTLLLRGAMEWLGARVSGKPFALEVDPDNVSAIALYKRAGFVVSTIYGYYAV